MCRDAPRRSTTAAYRRQGIFLRSIHPALKKQTLPEGLYQRGASFGLTLLGGVGSPSGSHLILAEESQPLTERLCWISNTCSNSLASRCSKRRARLRLGSQSGLSLSYGQGIRQVAGSRSNPSTRWPYIISIAPTRSSSYPQYLYFWVFRT